MKIMFHVFEYSVFYPCCKYEIHEGTSSSLPPSRISRGSLSLQGDPGAYMEETVRRVRPHTSARSVLRQQAVIEGGGELKFSFKSDSLYRGGKTSTTMSLPVECSLARAWGGRYQSQYIGGR